MKILRKHCAAFEDTHTTNPVTYPGLLESVEHGHGDGGDEPVAALCSLAVRHALSRWERHRSAGGVFCLSAGLWVLIWERDRSDGVVLCPSAGVGDRCSRVVESWDI